MSPNEKKGDQTVTTAQPYTHLRFQPLLSEEAAKDLRRISKDVIREAASRWAFKRCLSPLDPRDEQRIWNLCTYLLDSLPSALLDQHKVLTEFVGLASESDPLPVDHVFLALTTFEEAVAEVTIKEGGPSAGPILAWLHGFTLAAAYGIVKKMGVPVSERLQEIVREPSPLVRVLQMLEQPGDLRWIALATFDGPEPTLLDAALWDPATRRWTSAPRQEELLEEVRRGLKGNIPGIRTVEIGRGLFLAVQGPNTARSGAMIRQLCQWARVMVDGCLYHTPAGGKACDQLWMYETMLQIDNALLAAQTLFDLLYVCAREVCLLSGFQRSALFWYLPVSQLIQGVLSYRVRQEDILRIREPAANVPLFHRVLTEGKPVYVEDARPILPAGYIDRFRLTSLVVAPVLAWDRQTVGVLLMDRGGRPFAPDDRVLRLVESLLARVSRALGPHLFSSSTSLSPGPPAASLTHREHEILQLIADGLETKQIAYTLQISEYTVAEHIRSLLRKLGAKNRSEAVALGFRRRLIR